MIEQEQVVRVRTGWQHQITRDDITCTFQYRSPPTIEQMATGAVAADMVFKQSKANEVTRS